MTERPADARRYAAVSPVIPPPTTTTSACLLCSSLGNLGSDADSSQYEVVSICEVIRGFVSVSEPKQASSQDTWLIWQRCTQPTTDMAKLRTAKPFWLRRSPARRQTHKYPICRGEL